MKRRCQSGKRSQLALLTLILLTLSIVLRTQPVHASGFGVFTQGASGLGQANAVVAHPTGPSSLYFNPALLNDVPGRQVEFGTTAVLSRREVNLDSGGSDSTGDIWNFPVSFYYTHQGSDRVTSGFGVTFPFGLSNKWDGDYAGRYLGTSAEMFTMNLNPVISYLVTDHFSLAFGLDLLYLKSTLESKVNQTAAYWVTDKVYFNDELPDQNNLPDIAQKFEADGWGAGFNLGALFKATDQLTIGAAYRSEIDVEAEGDASFSNAVPLLSGSFQNSTGSADITLPAQATVGVAFQVSAPFVIEVGCRWEDWESTEHLKINLNSPLGETSQVIPRDWRATWAWNLGGHYRVNDRLAINAGYLYSDDPIPDSTFEPVIPDSPAHLFTVGADMNHGAWTLSGAFGYEYHESRDKTNRLGDPIGSMAAEEPANTANGEYTTDIYLIGVSLGYRF